MRVADTDRPVSWYHRLAERTVESITTIVLHATEIPDIDEAWDYAEQSAEKGTDGTGVCGHLYIDRDGTIYQFVPIDRIAAHAAGYNTPSIGIEMVNTGRYPHHFDSRHQDPAEPFPEPQIAALKKLLSDLSGECPDLRRLLRHSDIDARLVPASDDPEIKVRRRIDPGPRFPWHEVMAHWAALDRE